MQRNMLHTEQILASGYTLRDLSGNLRRALTRPRQAGGGDVGTLREDLEPVGSRAVPGVGRLARGHFGHVEL